MMTFKLPFCFLSQSFYKSSVCYHHIPWITTIIWYPKLDICNLALFFLKKYTHCDIRVYSHLQENSHLLPIVWLLICLGSLRKGIEFQSLAVFYISHTMKEGPRLYIHPVIFGFSSKIVLLIPVYIVQNGTFAYRYQRPSILCW